MPRGVYKRIIKAGMFGKKHSDKTKALISKNNARIWLGQKRPGHTEETKMKIRTARKSQIISIATRFKMSLSAKKGNDNNMWKGGVTPTHEKIRKSMEYKLWRDSVFKRDNYTCVSCGKKNGMGKTVKLNADHIKPFAIFPELRFSIQNGRTLCVNCHQSVTKAQHKNCLFVNSLRTRFISNNQTKTI